MSRLDLIKAKKHCKKTTPTNKPTGRGGLMGEKTQKSKEREDELSEDILGDDDFENELEDSSAAVYGEYDLNYGEDEDDGREVNVIELDIDLDSKKGLEIEPSLIREDNIKYDIESENHNSEDDIKLEVEYSFDHRDELYNNHAKVIKDGGLEVAASKILHLEDIIRISVTLSELKEQVDCEARVMSVFPRNISATDKNENQYRYIVQFIDPNATETERVLSKYLLGYKAK